MLVAGEPDPDAAAEGPASRTSGLPLGLRFRVILVPRLALEPAINAEDGGDEAEGTGGDPALLGLALDCSSLLTGDGG